MLLPCYKDGTAQGLFPLTAQFVDFRHPFKMEVAASLFLLQAAIASRRHMQCNMDVCNMDDALRTRASTLTVRRDPSSVAPPNTCFLSSIAAFISSAFVSSACTHKQAKHLPI